MQKRLLAASILLGLFFAYVDSRPTWDDTGVLAGAIALSCAILGALVPERPWLWALAIGLWIPLHNIPATHARGCIPVGARLSLRGRVRWSRRPEELRPNGVKLAMASSVFLRVTE